MYTLIYWPMLQGRGEFVRLLLEDADVPYNDIARNAEGGIAAVREHLYGEGDGDPAFAPPVLLHNDLKLAQVGAICAYLGPRHGLAPSDSAGQARVMQLQLTVLDVAVEAHNAHHPLGASLYYEDQKDEAQQAARLFRTERLPKWLGYFEKVLQQAGGGYLMGDKITYADLGLFQLVEGLRFAFPKASDKLLGATPGVSRLHQHIASRPRLADYLGSKRRIPFNNHGIFRAYPELDGED